MNLLPIVGTALGTALFQGAVRPGLAHYRTWRDGPRVRVARRNWRGVYVPDLAIKRAELLVKLGMVTFFILGCVGLWTVMVPPGR